MAQAAVVHAAGHYLALVWRIRLQLAVMLACTRVIRMSAAEVSGSAGPHRNHFADVKSKNNSLQVIKHTASPQFKLSLCWLRFSLPLSCK